MSPGSRLLLIVGSATLFTAGARLILEIIKAFIENETKTKKIDEIDKNSPSDSGFLPSILDDSDIPLVIIVNGLNYLNYIELSLILILLSLLFRKYLNRIIKNFILYLYNKYNKK